MKLIVRWLLPTCTPKIVIASSAALCVLTGCSQRPPGCADQATRSTARDVIVDEARRQLTADGDQDGVVKKVLDSASVELSAITSEGYVADAHKQMCRAHIKVLPAGADGLDGDVAYSTQRTEDDKSHFVLSMENVDQLAPALVTAARNQLNARRRVGSWSGQLDCGEVGGSRDGPRGPFKVPVVMDVTSSGDGAPLQASLERSVPQGQDLAVGLGTEHLRGAVADIFELTGAGSNVSMGQQWTTRMKVTFEDGRAVGRGDIYEADQAVRYCQFNLAKRASGGPASTVGSGEIPKDSSLAGTYVGEGDGTVTAEIGVPASNGTYQASISTQASAAGGGGCAGSASGTGHVDGSVLRITATDSNLGATCAISLTPDGKGGLHSEEGAGCSAFHGATCGFTAGLARK